MFSFSFLVLSLKSLFCHPKIGSCCDDSWNQHHDKEDDSENRRNTKYEIDCVKCYNDTHGRFKSNLKESVNPSMDSSINDINESSCSDSFDHISICLNEFFEINSIIESCPIKKNFCPSFFVEQKTGSHKKYWNTCIPIEKSIKIIKAFSNKRLENIA